MSAVSRCTPSISGSSKGLNHSVSTGDYRVAMAETDQDSESTDRPPLSLGDLAGFPVTSITSVGPKRAAALAKLEITTVLDLLTHYPRRYIDRTREATIGELAVGEEGMVLAEVQRVSSRRTRNRRIMVNVTIGDATGRLSLTFFNQPWRERQLREGMQVVVFGKVEQYQGARQMSNPVVDLLGDQAGRIVPVYPQSEKAGVQSGELARWNLTALAKCAPRGFSDPVPRAVLQRWNLVSRGEAFANIHHPESMVEAQVARSRLVFDELLRVQLELVQRKLERARTSVGIVHQLDGELVGAFHQQLPFKLTAAQHRAIDEIEVDLASPQPMHRLLQGDVGSGKTLVAVSALLVGVQGGHQGAFMAPTEVLAEQHHLGVVELLRDFTVADDSNIFGERPLRVELLTSRVSGADRTKVIADLGSGLVDIVIGTHALIQDAVDFSSLGVVVIDEQHRFGVEQRAALRDKNSSGLVPDVLVMTATPIPRTAAMTVYGDLDVSILDELPPGRTPIETHWAKGPLDDLMVWDRVRSEAAAGRQTYVVCPLIEISDKLEVRSAEEVYEELAGGELSELRLGLLHGRVAPAEKEATMASFRAGEIDVLVATTVIEVGVDVANATVMVIVDADRFGIAQLHQLRGRVGRGEQRSYCCLLAEEVSADGEERLAAVVRSTDGFELAEVDLELRGEGTIMGERQKGQNDLRLASLRRDRIWVERARDVAFELVDPKSELADYPELAEELRLFLGETESDFLLKG